MLCLVSFALSKEETICENHVYLYFAPCVIFSSIFLNVPFSHVLHLDAIRSQSELKMKMKT